MPVVVVVAVKLVGLCRSREEGCPSADPIGSKLGHVGVRRILPFEGRTVGHSPTIDLFSANGSIDVV